MTAAMPNTIIHLPPQHRRSVSEIVLLLFVGIVIPLLLLWLLFRAFDAPTAMPDSAPPPAAAVETPVVVEVVMRYPTPTPEDTPHPTWTPSDVDSDWCDPSYTRPGETCTKPFPPPPTPTPLLSCVSQLVAAGERCRWPESTANDQLWD
jgi:hypothetical protein